MLEIYLIPCYFLKKNKMLNYFLLLLKKLKFSLTRTSFSQAGEDAILRFLFNDYGLKKITYLDLGTNSPFFNNNTYWFYLNKSTGVCVEADINLVQLIKKFRPKDTTLHAGVSASNNTHSLFYIFDEPALNTFNKNEVDSRLKSGKNKLIRTVNVPLLNINHILSTYFDKTPDLLSIDIEGFDLDVIKSIDYLKHPIPVICIESCDYSENHIRPKNHLLAKYLEDKGYNVYADTYINTIFVNKKWFYKHSS